MTPYSMTPYSITQTLCRFQRISATEIECEACHTVRTWEGDPATYRRNCSAVVAPAADAAAAPPSRGLGDTISKLTHATGIAQAVEALSKATGVPCGCKGRQDWLNKMVPYEVKDESSKS
jgi:hypothetical protein